MDTPKPGKPVEEVPLGQRLFDNMFLLLALGLLVMFVFFTGCCSTAARPVSHAEPYFEAGEAHSTSS